ncbi:uncharacterized protein LOC124615673 [Schistocerca americana]|uniref:uncharacterized protein LOC124615673 n=1 Tax=Schistocerca americana TaxID=7009 RepID=UPI001F500890|nr:uncharacterized protein LOC124615673 [Schistocerca americana]XP_049962897.1 uncharacterized protein LOC126483782 [Schistocerca serialis cubense]
MDESKMVNTGDKRPECVKTQLFRRTMESIFKGICKDIDEGVMQECYGKLLGKYPATISKIHSRFIDYVETEFKEKIDELVIEENVNEKFLQLQKLEEDISPGNVKWLPSRNCLNDIRSHDCQKQMQLKQELVALVEKEEAEVEKMRMKVEDARKQYANLQSKVSNLTEISSKLNTCTERIEILLENLVSDLEIGHYIYE